MPDQKFRPQNLGNGLTVYPGIITKVTPTYITVLIHRGKLLEIRRTDDVDSMPNPQLMYGTHHTVFLMALRGYERPIGFRILPGERPAPPIYDASKDADVTNLFVHVNVGGGFSNRDIFVCVPTPVEEHTRHSEPQARL